MLTRRVWLVWLCSSVRHRWRVWPYIAAWGLSNFLAPMARLSLGPCYFRCRMPMYSIRL